MLFKKLNLELDKSVSKVQLEDKWVNIDQSVIKSNWGNGQCQLFKYIKSFKSQNLTVPCKNNSKDTRVIQKYNSKDTIKLKVILYLKTM